jgi:hypothetical protein
MAVLTSRSNPVGDEHARRRLTEWIDATMHARVVEIEPQPRWRRGWYVTATRNGTTFDLYLRGDRDSTFNSLPFEIEAQYHEILERHGIPVPHVYGVCSDPRAIVMDLIPGSRDISALSRMGRSRSLRSMCNCSYGSTRSTRRSSKRWACGEQRLLARPA